MALTRAKAASPQTRGEVKRLQEEILEKKFETFLEHYALTGLRGDSLEISGLSRMQLRRLLEDPTKAEAFKFAEEEATSSLEDEATYRATKGTLTPIFNRDGRRVATVRKKSDLLLIFMLKARAPHKYRDNAPPPPQDYEQLDYDNPRERLARRITGIQERLPGHPPVIDHE